MEAKTKKDEDEHIADLIKLSQLSEKKYFANSAKTIQ